MNEAQALQPIKAVAPAEMKSTGKEMGGVERVKTKAKEWSERGKKLLARLKAKAEDKPREVLEEVKTAPGIDEVFIDISTAKKNDNKNLSINHLDVNGTNKQEPKDDKKELEILSTPLPEHTPKVYDENYHGTNIHVIELDHHDSEQAGIDYKLPENWQALLKLQIEQTKGPIAPEYCLPDLERYLFRFNGPVGFLAREQLSPVGFGGDKKKDTPDSHIIPFYGFISKTAGEMQRNLIATDTANKAVFWLYSGADIAKHQSNENIRKFNPTSGRAEFKYEYGNIDPSEYKKHDSNDSRHLVTARGLMQEALRSEQKQITAIWAPKHAERIADYIKRQRNQESASSEKVEKPSDFKNISPADEANKMISYGRPPLMRSVREYQPVFSSTAYKVDLLVNDDAKLVHPEELIATMTSYLKQEPVNNDEKKHQKKVKKALNRLANPKVKKLIKMEPSGWGEILMGNDSIKRLVNTDRSGWKLTKNEYVY